MKNQTKKVSIGTIILTYNEEIHIERCIENAKRFSEQIYVIDSFSTDNTVAIAKGLGAKVLQNKWENNHAKQLNWGLENANFQTDWILRLDADEYLTDELIDEIKEKLPTLEENITGVVLPRGNYFLGRKITKGVGVVNLLRLFRRDKAFCEDRHMDEHMVLKEGVSIEFSNNMVDNNLNNLTLWTTKHNGYSNREASDLLSLKYGLENKQNNTDEKLTKQAGVKRNWKKKYANMPLFWRVAAYFCYRYFLKGGFLEGKEGFLWHFLQGFWYRMLVDAKIYQIEKECEGNKDKIIRYLEENYQIKI